MSDKEPGDKQPDYARLYRELMRNAGPHRRAISKRMLANERRFRGEQKRIRQQRTMAERTQRVERDLRRHAEDMHLAAQIERELKALGEKLAAVIGSEERIMLKAEIVHLRMLLSTLTNKRPKRRKRKPPEAGLPVPAVPPEGPQPMSGGAAAPLDFEA